MQLFLEKVADGLGRGAPNRLRQQAIAKQKGANFARRAKERTKVCKFRTEIITKIAQSTVQHSQIKIFSKKIQKKG